jgi:pimeloyl-ACP methyl ester carboxylesterase
MVPFMRRWVSLYSENVLTHGVLPSWFYGMVAMAGVRNVQRARQVRFLHVEESMPRLKRPLLMIHGGDDSYISVDMASELFRRAAGAKAFWVVPGAKHNQAINIAGDEYCKRVVSFFDTHLASLEPAGVASELLEDVADLSERAMAPA